MSTLTLVLRDIGNVQDTHRPVGAERYSTTARRHPWDLHTVLSVSSHHSRRFEIGDFHRASVSVLIMTWARCLYRARWQERTLLSQKKHNEETY